MGGDSPPAVAPDGDRAKWYKGRVRAVRARGTSVEHQVKVEFLAIGDELLRGESREGNGAWLAGQLAQRGVTLAQLQVIPDDSQRIALAISDASRRPTLLICSGGLGPTDDDFTRAAVAQALGVPLIQIAEALAAIEARFAKLGRAMHPLNARQAVFPEGATVIPNAFGTAPGFALRRGDLRLVCLPGVPREFCGLVEAGLDQWLADSRIAVGVAKTEVTLRLFGIPESNMQGILQGLPHYPAAKLRSLPSWPEIRLKLGPKDSQAHAEFEELLAEVRSALDWRIYGEGDSDSHAAAALRALRARQMRVAIAESCTGGLVAQLITQEPGASETLIAAVVAYANSAKIQILGVDAELLEAHGAVSQAVAVEMARGALRISGADVAIATTGIAGPTGASPGKTVGTLWLALAWPGGVVSRSFLFAGVDRQRFQSSAAHTALSWLRRHALGKLDAEQL